MLKTKYEHIHFEKSDLRKTDYSLRGNRSYFVMGMVSYYKPWKKYVVQYFEGYVLDENCLRDTADFLDQLNEQHKLKRNNNVNKTTTSSK